MCSVPGNRREPMEHRGCAKMGGCAAAEGRLTFAELSIVLYLRAAQVTGRAVTIGAGTVFGDVELLVPEGVGVEIRSRTIFGDVRQRAGTAAPPGAPLVIVTGGTVFGDVTVHHTRLRERLGLPAAR